ncbi:uncharacterized protein LOC122662996 [Telopea speciosissima]|uniref:uncharacterized protein LOC122662996 n=1 Tax=Telopea speciosissima TaxID=54955 RepID=UPI001CC6462C|nr:uncharacterized protein LOC122662996 [Telopea speciosissima]
MGAIRYGALDTGVVPGIRSIVNSVSSGGSWYFGVSLAGEYEDGDRSKPISKTLIQKMKMQGEPESNPEFEEEMEMEQEAAEGAGLGEQEGDPKVELNEDDKWAETKEPRKKTIALKAANFSDDESNEDENLSIKPGHFKTEYSKGQDKKKAYITEISWDSDEEQEEGQSDEETINLALMVHERENKLEVNSDFYSSNSINSNSIDDIDTYDIDENDIERGFEALYETFDINAQKASCTPMSTSLSLSKDENGTPFDSTRYRGMIGSLLYLTASRPDIMFSVCACARFQASPMKSHTSAIKRIFKYLKNTVNVGLWYPMNNNFELLSFSDADFADCHLDRKSISGTCHFLASCLVSWFSKKQNCVSLSITEAEYIAVGRCCAQIL